MQMRALSNNHLGPLRDALTLAGLPVDDLTYPGRQFFSFSHQGVEVAFAGIEGEGAERLLRSVVVLEGLRGKGTGAAVLAAIEAFAKREGAERLHLLTESAAAFFTGQGYRPGDRSLAPVSISATAQFKTLCPASATYLSKHLV